jgi:hypothetical protein
MTGNASFIPIERIERLIVLLRGHKVMLDSDLARLDGVTTTRLNQQVRRNPDRFPLDFMFQLTTDEFADLMLQNATSSSGYGGRRKRPYAFTEHGAIMLASVLNSPVAVRARLQVVRAFVRLRQLLASDQELARKLAELEQRVAGHDEHIQSLFEAIRRLMAPPTTERKRIGFEVRERRARYGRYAAADSDA